jgi:hypothetical protein
MGRFIAGREVNYTEKINKNIIKKIYPILNNNQNISDIK